MIAHCNFERARRNRKEGLLKGAQVCLRRSKDQCDKGYQKLIEFEEKNLAAAVAKYEEISASKEPEDGLAKELNEHAEQKSTEAGGSGSAVELAKQAEESTSAAADGGGWMPDDERSVNTEKLRRFKGKY